MSEPTPHPTAGSGHDPSGGGATNRGPAAGDGTPAEAAAVASGSVSFACPTCGHDVPLPADSTGGLLTCPACGSDFFAAVEPSNDDRDAAEQLEAERQLRQRALDEARIKMMVIGRRAAIRTRSYWVIALCVAAAVAAELVWRGVRNWRAVGPSVWPVVQWVGAAACLGLGRRCLNPIRELDAELAAPPQAEPSEPPDFSTLSDGSHRAAEAAAELERMNRAG